MKSRDEIFNILVTILVDEFELERDSITSDVNLYSDLDLDSIDAVDLVVKLQNIFGKKIGPEIFKKVRTISDVIDAIEKLLKDS